MKPHSRSLYPFITCLFAVLLAASGSAAAADVLTNTHRLIVKFSSPMDAGLSAEQLQRLSGHAGVPLAESHLMSDNACVLLLPQQVSVTEASRIATRLATDPSIEYAEPDRRKRPAIDPDDSFFNQQWNLAGDPGGIHANTAWDTEQGSPGIVIATVDTGILAHSDLDPLRQVPGYDFITSPVFSNDGDGRDADPSDPGDWVAAGECDPGDPPQDSSWHGTAVTGVIGAATNNAQGIAGVNIGSRLLMARALGKCGGFTSDIMEAARWAAGLRVPGVPDNANPARVINLSFSGQGSCTLTERNAINAINARGGVVVVAAGNQAGDVAQHSPANCSGVLTVAATTQSGGRTVYTNTGTGIDLSAPGGDAGNGILSVYNTGVMVPAADDFIALAGTSFATAHVSGVAALVLSVKENLSSQQVRDILVNSARPFPNAFPDTNCTVAACGSGIVDASAAVLLAAATPGQPDADNDGVNDAVDACLGTPAGAVVNAAGCSAAQLNPGGGGGGGGGCSISHTTGVDPLLPVLLLFAVINLVYARR